MQYIKAPFHLHPLIRHFVTTRNSDIIDIICKTDSDDRNSVLFLDQSVIGPTGVSITQSADDLTVPDCSVSRTIPGTDLFSDGSAGTCGY